MDDRWTIILQYFLGDNEDTAEDCSSQLSDERALPSVGDHVSIWGTRNKDGNYSRKESEKDMEGIVTRIEHTYEQYGTSHLDWRMRHFIQIFLKKESSLPTK
jgi:hypothetical protein